MRATARGQQVYAAGMPVVLGEVLGVGMWSWPWIELCWAHNERPARRMCHRGHTRTVTNQSDKSPLRFWGQSVAQTDP